MCSTYFVQNIIQKYEEKSSLSCKFHAHTFNSIENSSYLRCQRNTMPAAHYKSGTVCFTNVLSLGQWDSGLCCCRAQ